MRSLVTLIVMAKFIITDYLTPANTAAELMGCEWGTTVEGWPGPADEVVEQEGTESIQLTAEDYLQGIIGMVNELVRTHFRLR